MSTEREEGQVGDEVLTTREAAGLLRVHVETIRRLARRGELPAFRVGKDWRFRRKALLRWAETHHVRQRAPRILVVDDDEIVRGLFQRLLEGEGYSVETASDGDAGLERVAHDSPDLVLLDLRMPGMGGVEFLRRFRQDHISVGVMAVAGYPDGNLMEEAMRHGPLTVLGKPVENEQLVMAVRVALKGALGTQSQ